MTFGSTTPIKYPGRSESLRLVLPRNSVNPFFIIPSDCVEFPLYLSNSSLLRKHVFAARIFLDMHSKFTFYIFDEIPFSFCFQWLLKTVCVIANLTTYSTFYSSQLMDICLKEK